MNHHSILRLALLILGSGFLLCLAGIIWLASANPARAIPDVLVGTIGLIGGAIVGVLVPTQPQRILGKAVAGNLPPTTEKPGGMRARDEGEASVLYILAVVVVVVVLFVLLTRVL